MPRFTNLLLANRSVLDSVQTNWNTTVKGYYDTTFNAVGLRQTVAQSGAIPAGGTTTFGYNDRWELTGGDFSVGTDKDYTWEYDLMGKRTSAVNNGSTTTYAAVADAAKDVNEYASITGESGLSYDADGNLTADGTWTYSYDAENRLIGMNRKDSFQYLSFDYDYMGRRVKKTVRNGAFIVTGCTKFVWSGWRLSAELDGGTNQAGTTVAKTYVWGSDLSGGAGAGGLLSVTQGGSTYYPAYDVQGNVTGYLNAGSSGAVAASYEYNAYGQIIASGGSASSFAFGFSTQYTDRETGLVYYGLRYYSPKHGRFVNRDPIEENGGTNLYNFVGNSPANGWDVLGMNALAGWWAGGRDRPMRPDEAYTLALNRARPSGVINTPAPNDPDVWSQWAMMQDLAEWSATADDFQLRADAANSGAAPSDTARITPGSGLGNALRHIPLLGGLLGGAGDIVSGAFNTAAGIVTFGQSGTLGRGLGQIAGGAGEVVGRVWSIPNTAVGLAFGGVGILFGATPRWDSNAGILQFTGMPNGLMPTAMSLGSVNVFGRNAPPGGDNNVGVGVSAGREESLHTVQSRILGPLYFPAHLLGGMISVFTPDQKSWNPGFDYWHRNNFMEQGPMHGRVF